MELKQLEYFRMIVDAGTISAAARKLNMTQPPLSYQIKMLEEELQVQLFVRGTKNITLTEAGKALYVRADSILTMADITRREVIKASQAATIHLGMTPSTVAMMGERIAIFAKKHPQIRFDIHDGTTFTLKNRLEKGIVDISTLRTPIPLKGLSYRTLAKEELMAMATGELLPEGCRSVSLKMLAGQKLILSQRYRKYLLNAFEEEGLTCDIFFECEDARTAMTMAENGLGIAILPASMKYMTKQMHSCHIEGADLSTEIILAWKEETLPTEARTFIEEIGTFVH